MKIGLIQSRGIGDIIIALPIARYFVDRGDEVYWPIDESFLPSFVSSAPYVTWLPLNREGDWFFDVPLQMLQSAGCGRIISLYSYLSHRQNVSNKALFEFMKFDEYKYAIAGVPFGEKWNLNIVRNLKREREFFVDIVKNENEPFAIAHLHGSNFDSKLDVEPLVDGCPVIHIKPLTDNIFDWLTIIERASVRVMIDSCFSNLTEQLRIPGKKYFIHRSHVLFSPVLTSDWSFVALRQTNSMPLAPHLDAALPLQRPVSTQHPYIGTPRNDRCPCGSGKKYKHCHGRYA